MATEPGKPSLVVVALDAAERGEHVIELARALARSDTPEVLGVFVESSELLAHAGSRLAREILLSGAERALEHARLERQLRSQAARARAAFEAVSARLGLRHRFEITRGDLLSESVKRAGTAEVLVVSLAQAVAGRASSTALLRELAAPSPPLVVLARHGWSPGQSVAVLFDEASSVNEAALLAAARVAIHGRSPLTALVPVSGDADANEVLERVAAKLAAFGVPVPHVIQLERADAAAISRASRACHARLLVLPSSGDNMGPASEVDELMQRFPGALMLVRR